MADAEQDAVAVRKNMERLRLLREARQAQEIGAEAASSPVPKKKRKKSAL